MKKCLETCKKLDVACPISDCRHWIDYEKESNCIFESININGSMTLRQVADRIGMSYVRVKQIQDQTLNKISGLFE